MCIILSPLQNYYLNITTKSRYMINNELTLNDQIRKVTKRNSPDMVVKFQTRRRRMWLTRVRICTLPACVGQPYIS